MSPVTPSSQPLKGLGVVSFESRLAAEMAKLVRNFGGDVITAPSMQEIPFEKNLEALAFGERLIAGKIDMAVFLTGVGTRALFDVMETRHPREQFVKALSSVAVVARGPKPIRVLREYGVPIAVEVPEPNTWREVLREIDENEESIPLEGKTVAVQEYGEENEEFIEELRKRKATVVRVPVYRWALPDDTGPLKDGIRAILDGRAAAALFTNKVQIEHVMRVASEEGCEDRLKKAFRGVVVASIGPVCTEGLLSHGVSVDFEPAHSKIGSFVMEAAGAIPAILSGKRTPSVTGGQARPAGETRDRGFSAEALRDSIFMKAARREKTEATPVWFMRQAGRYMKEYREIRRKLSFADLCRDPDRVTEVTLRAQEFLGADAAIIFSDILLLLECFGFGLEYVSEDGPVVKTEGPGKIPALKESDIRSQLAFVFDAIGRTRRALAKNIPLLGFAGAPFTLASYIIEGGASKSFRRTKTLMYRDRGAWDALLSPISDALVIFLNAQIAAGAQAVQLFDSWVGCLGPDDYAAYVKPYSERVIRGVKGGPVIHFGTGTAPFLETMAAAGGDVIGVDWRVRLDEAWTRIGPAKAIQGNLDPLVLCADRAFIKEKIRHILAQAGGRPGHIFNLGHGVLPETPEENVRYAADLVHELSRKNSRES